MSEIVIIGGGFGGLSFLKAARKSKNNFTLKFGLPSIPKLKNNERETY
mgnify:CR=1 FL=1